MAGLKIRKGDTVEILAGKDRGKRGKVLVTYASEGRVIVEGRNIVRRHERARPGARHARRADDARRRDREAGGRSTPRTSASSARRAAR